MGIRVYRGGGFEGSPMIFTSKVLGDKYLDLQSADLDILEEHQIIARMREILKKLILIEGILGMNTNGQSRSQI